MAHIKSISFNAVSTNYGCTCDKCGKWIKNIWTVKFDDGISMNFGIDCYEKMYKSGTLTKAGVKAMKDALKSIEHYTKYREEWKYMTEADAKEKGLLDELDPNAYCNRYNKSYWCGKTFDEYKEWMLNEWFPARFEEAQKKIDRFSNVNFDR